ncbi:MAG: ABC transporter substrate-binding protein, partial [Flavobacteriales bacterium]|nr:ABC transporter substrate-binding protein [Flavobacteriales bacterium]
MRFALLFFVPVFFLIACTGEKKDDQRTVFHYNESNGISSLDPAFARNLENMWAVNQLFDGLVELDENMKVQ